MRQRKEPFKIDFTKPIDKNVKEIAKEMFVAPPRGGALTLPGPSLATKKTRKRKNKDREQEKEEKRFDNTLPDDMHFSSKQLVTLFLKPKFSVSRRVIPLLNSVVTTVSSRSLRCVVSAADLMTVRRAKSMRTSGHRQLQSKPQAARAQTTWTQVSYPAPLPVPL